MKSYMTPHVWLTIFLLCLWIVTGCGPTNSTQQQFLNARQQLHQGQFANAASQLSLFLGQHPQDPLACRASFLLAKAYLGQNQTDLATDQFQYTVDHFPDSEEAHKSLYKLAFLAWLAKDLSKTRQLLTTLRQQEGPYRAEAEALWQQCQSPDLSETGSNQP